ncbi:MAG: VOC family protein [Nocardioidaceae bacterium]
MSAYVQAIAVDTPDPYTLATWWSGVLDLPLAADDYPGDPVASLRLGDDIELIFVAVDDPKTVKNRLHLDLRPRDRNRDAEIERVLALGATQIADHRQPDGTGWAVLADPEGNEFCIVRSAAERAGT